MYHGVSPVVLLPLISQEKIMRTFLNLLVASFLCTTFSITCTAASAEVTVGSPAPDFTLTDASGTPVSLSSFKGRTVVLEWFNPGCPFVKKFYSNGDMQRFQSKVVGDGGVWLTINSSAPGKQGHISADKAKEVSAEQKLQSTALLLDSEGKVGKTYGARTTPHMFVIDAKGTLVYDGAIDSEASTDSDDIAGATNYVLAAIDTLKSGGAVSPASTEPYGCSVKY